MLAAESSDDPTAQARPDAISHPGAIRINVQGAFIIDQDSVSPVIEAVDGIDYQHDTKDIRLPNHKIAVSHVAVDVRIEPHFTWLFC